MSCSKFYQYYILGQVVNSEMNRGTPSCSIWTLFNNSFSPSPLLYTASTLTTTMTYDEGLGYMPSGSSNDQFRISDPLLRCCSIDKILFNDDYWLPSNEDLSAVWSDNDHLQAAWSSVVTTCSSPVLKCAHKISGMTSISRLSRYPLLDLHQWNPTFKYSQQRLYWNGC